MGKGRGSLMPGTQTLVGVETEKYCRKYPTVPNRTLSRMMHKENPKLFTSVEQARNAVRLYRGTHGVESRGANFRMNRVIPYNPKYPNLPYAEPNVWSPYIVPMNIHSMLVTADEHIPFYNKEGFEIAVEAGRKRKVDCWMRLGDYWDCYMLSKFVKNPLMRRTKEEMEMMFSIEEEVTRYLNKPFKVYKLGNHEERIPTYLWTQAPELAHLKGVQMEAILEARERNTVIVGDKRIIKFGHLTLLHGHEFGGFIQSPVNPARTLFLKTKAVAACGHQHQSSQHSEPDINGKSIACWSIGALCDLHPAYRPINKWNAGFAIATRAKNNGFIFENFRIIDGSIFPA